MKQVAIGIDIGGTYTKLGIVDKQGQTLSDSFIDTKGDGGFSEYVKRLIKEINKIKNNCSKELKLEGVGIGAPNGNYYRGTIEQAPNLPWGKKSLSLVDEFKKYFDFPVILTNDANAAAMGELLYGGAKNMSDFLVVTLGTGLGSGFIANRQMIYGHDGFAGELGHIIVRPGGRQCNCGLKGCLETYVSATGIKRTVFELLGKTIYQSNLRTIPFKDLEAADISKEAEKGDKIAQEAFEVTGNILGESLAKCIAITSPQAIFLTGGLAKAGHLIFEPTKRAMDKNTLNIFKGKVKLLPSGLANGANAAVAGASALVWKEIDEKNK